MQTVLSLWSSRGLTVGGKILVFKTLGLSKMQYIALMTLVPKQMIEQLKLVHKKLLWKNDIPRMKHSTLYNNDGKLRSFNELTEKGIPRKMYFRWLQLIGAIPSQWKSKIKDHFMREEYSSHKIIAKYDCITDDSIMPIPSLACESMYTKCVQQLSTPPTSIKYFNEKLKLQDHFD